MQKSSFEGRGDKKFVRFTFYITPITKDLADEVCPAIGSLLFKKDDQGAFVPVQEMDSVEFEIGKIPLQTMELHPIDDPAMDLHGVMLTGVEISEIIARKVIAGNPNFSLIFRAEVSKDSLAVQMMDKYFREKVHLTFQQMQGEMFPDDDVLDTIKNPVCEECQDRAIYRDSEKTYYCAKHVRMASGEARLIVTQETPAQAQKRIMAERDATNPQAKVNELIDKASDAKAALEQEDPNAETGLFINTRAKKRKSKTAEVVN